MKLKFKRLSLIIFSILLLFFTIACEEADEGENNNPGNNEEPAVYVKTRELKYEQFTQYISVLGVAKAFYQSVLSSDEGGRIKEFVKDKGRFVNKDDVILILDNDVLKANLDAAKARFDQAENNFVRQEKIYNENVTSELQYLNAKYERDAAKANYELIKARYDRTFIKAPFSGIVDQKYAEIGELTLPGLPIVSVVSMGRIKVEAGVPENYITMVERGDSVKVIFKDLGDAEYSAVLNYVGNTVSTDNRTFPIEIFINNKDGRIKPELSARVFIQKEKVDNAIVIPEETVTKTDLGYAVFVEEDGVAKMRIVEIISRSDNQIALRSGVNEGDKLVLVGFQNLVDGTKVKVVN